MSRLGTILAQGARDFSNAVFGLYRFSWSSRRTSHARKKKKKKKKEKKKKKKNFCHPGYKNDGIHNVRVYVKMQFCLNSEFTVNEGISAKGELNYGL